MRKNRLLLCLLTLLAMFPAAHAATLASYQFTGTDEATRRSATIIDPLISSTTAITFGGSGLDPQSNYAFTSNAPGANAVGNTLRVLGIERTSVSPLPTQFIEFSLTPSTAVNLTSFEFDYAVGGMGNRTVLVQYSFDGFATAGLTAGQITYDTTSPGGTGQNINSFYHHSFALTDQNALAESTNSTITFRLFLATPSTGADVRLDNFTILGTAVPEPSLSALFGLPVAGLLLRRHRR